MSIKLKNLFLVLLSGIPFLITGCSAIDWLLEPDPTRIELEFVASEDLNKTIDGKGAPVMVRIYQLKSIDVFANADIFALHEDDINILGDDKLEREQTTFVPNENRAEALAPHPEAEFIAIFAAFRDFENANGQWRAFTAIPKNTTTQIRVLVSEKRYRPFS